MIKITAYKPDANNTREGYADAIIQTEYGPQIMRHIAVFRKDTRRWFSFPSRKTDLIDEFGKEVYSPHTQYIEAEQVSRLHREFFASLDQFKGQKQATENTNEEAPF